MKTLLKELIDKESGWVELRFHKRTQNNFAVQKGRVDSANSFVNSGVGVRVWENGSFGFCSTALLDKENILKAIEVAKKNAYELGSIRREKIPALNPWELAKGDFVCEGYLELMDMPLEAKLGHLMEMEQETLKRSSLIHTVGCSYKEIFEEKIIVTTDGAFASKKIAQPELRLNAQASKDGEHNVGHSSVGITGNWKDLFNHPTSKPIIEEVSVMAVDLLGAPKVEGGNHTVILSPSLVGLLAHEAVGHTVEADFVLAGSVAQGKIGQEVASSLVTLCDSGDSEYHPGATGTIAFDDEGVLTQKTKIITEGKLTSYLHNRESAAKFGVSPTGNARAWLYDDEPLIRMRNTYLEPGTQSLEEIIDSTEKGYLLIGAGGGQADATGEFMFGSSYAQEITNGKIGKKFKEVTLSGVAFDMLKTVDAVSSEFLWDLGSGYCGKGQPAKVDAGGPYVRAKMTLGGEQK